MDKSREVKEWMRFVSMDLDIAKHLMVSMWPTPYEIICFHCQQSAEKALKAILVANNQPVKKTHDLQLLTTLLKPFADIPEYILEYTESLTRFGAQMRYPQEFSVDEIETKMSIAQAQKVKEWAEGIIGDIEDGEQGVEA